MGSGYCNRSHIEARLPAAVLLSFADLDRDGAEDAGVVDQAIADASDVCDSYLSVRYPVPVATPAGALRTAAVSIAIWKLATASGFDPSSADKVLQLEYDAAIRWLRDVSQGKAGLPSSAATTESPAAPDVAVKSFTREPTFVGKLDRYG